MRVESVSQLKSRCLPSGEIVTSRVLRPNQRKFKAAFHSLNCKKNSRENRKLVKRSSISLYHSSSCFGKGFDKSFTTCKLRTGIAKCSRKCRSTVSKINTLRLVLSKQILSESAQCVCVKRWATKSALLTRPASVKLSPIMNKSRFFLVVDEPNLGAQGCVFSLNCSKLDIR